jgi:hypothetical protein
MSSENARALVEPSAGGAPRSGATPGGTLYLEQNLNRVTAQEGTDRIEVRSCGCKSWFCERCCVSKGIELKGKLNRELQAFTGLMMLTLTTDPELFGSPAAAYKFIKENRCIAVMIQRLHRRGFLHSRRFLYVVEWQKESQQAHWHVLVDASHIPFPELCEAWNRNWPGWRERVEAGRPGLGSVRFSKKDLNRTHAAGYVTAYLTKAPQQGYPQWVTDSPVRAVRRYDTSRGFWRADHRDSDEGTPTDADNGDTGDEDVPGEVERPEDTPRSTLRRSIKEQVDNCGARCVVLRAVDVLNVETGERSVSRRFLRIVHAPLESLLATGVAPDEVNKRATLAIFRDCRAFLGSLNGRLRKLGTLGYNLFSSHWETNNNGNPEVQTSDPRSDVEDHHGGVREVLGRLRDSGVGHRRIDLRPVGRLARSATDALRSDVQALRGDPGYQVPGGAPVPDADVRTDAGNTLDESGREVLAGGDGGTCLGQGRGPGRSGIISYWDLKSKLDTL